MHPTERDLIDFALGETGAKDRARIERHLAERCAGCSRRVEEYRELFEAMRTDRMAEPPSAWVERAVALRRSGSWLEKVREWCRGSAEELGRVAFDSFAVPGLAPAGVRSVDMERRLRFESGDVELDVRVEPRGRGGIVTGQLVELGREPRPLAGARYLITAGTLESAVGVADDFGEFTVEMPQLEKLVIRVARPDRVATFEIPGVPLAEG
jgi:hypothetical protein